MIGKRLTRSTGSTPATITGTKTNETSVEPVRA